MNNLERNAIKIAELIGLPTTPSNTFVFEYYDGLMPIVFECNININYRIHIYEECVIFSTADGEMLLPKLKYDLEPEFIEAIQLACIKYLELK